MNLAYSSRNRSASVRIPMYSASPKLKRLEVRFPDPSCNGYLAFSALLMAALDGIENRIDPGEPLDRDIYAMSPEELANVPSTPGSLDAALDALEKDHEFLLKGDVFTEDVIQTWIEYKRLNESRQPCACVRIPMSSNCISTFNCRKRFLNEHEAFQRSWSLKGLVCLEFVLCILDATGFELSSVVNRPSDLSCAQVPPARHHHLSRERKSPRLPDTIRRRRSFHHADGGKVYHFLGGDAVLAQMGGQPCPREESPMATASPMQLKSSRAIFPD